MANYQYNIKQHFYKSYCRTIIYRYSNRFQSERVKYWLIHPSTSSFVLTGDRDTLLLRVYYVRTQKGAATTVEKATLGQKQPNESREARQRKEAVFLSLSLFYWTTTNDCPEAKRSWRQSDWLQRRAATAPEIWAVFNQCLLKKNNTMDHLLKTGRGKTFAL